MDPVFIRFTGDGRPIEIIDGWLCLDGRPETRELTVLDEHPNRQAILNACPRATHVGGRLPLTMAEASVAQAALRRANDSFDGSPGASHERLRRGAWLKARTDGIE